MDNISKDKSNLMKALGILVLLACIYIVALTVTEFKGFKFIGGGAPASNVISFEGKGEVSAKPDLATISFSITDNQKEMATAQDNVTKKETAVLAFLETSGIEKKDIKTEGYNSYPKYDYVNCGETYFIQCRGGNSKLIGYEVSESMEVKVRDLTKTGDIVKGLGAAGVSNISGPNFSIEKEDDIKAQARKMAIEEAKAKAEVLAKDLGVRLVRIVNFSENGNYPMMYDGAMMVKNGIESALATAQTPELPTGENKIISNVTITYEIR